MSERPDPPLAGRYWPAAALALLALCPNIVLTTAVPLLQHSLHGSLRLSGLGVSTAEGLSNAGYALGAVIAAFLVQRFRQRMLFLVVEGGFVLASAVAALAWTPGAFVAGRIVQGAATGLMLVIALPPLVTRYGADRLPRTAGLLNVGLFGAVTAGPLVGGAAATGPAAWRWLFAGVAALGAAGVILAASSLDHQPPYDRSVPPDWSAFALAAAGTVLPFFGVSRLAAHGVTEPVVWAPVAVGLASLTLLVIRQYRRPDALMPVRALSTSLPVVGTVTAMLAGAAVVTLVSLTVASLLAAQHTAPLAAGALLAPQVAGVGIAAFVFARLLRSRWLPLLVVAGLLVIGAAGVLLLDPTGTAAVLAAAALLGLGAGATVSPGLFLAAFGVPSSRIGRAFALVELLRSEAAYLVGPVLLYLARSQSSLADGLRTATWVVIALVAGTLVLVVGLYVASGARPAEPDLAAWLDGDDQALRSPPTAAVARERVRAVAR